MDYIIIFGLMFIVGIWAIAIVDWDNAPTSDMNFSQQSSSESASHSDTKSRHTVQPQTMGPQPVSDSASRTTSRLVGNGLAYFVFWWFGAPILAFFVFILFFLTGMLKDSTGWLLYFMFVVSLLIAFVYHTFQISYSGIKASVASDDSHNNVIPVQVIQAKPDTGRVPCPMCAEMIMPQAKMCHFCKTILEPPVVGD